MLTVVIRYSKMLHRNIIVCVITRPQTHTIRSDCLRNGRSRSLYPSIRMVIKVFIEINSDLENILSLEK
jgi:hypothetical protein